MNIVIDETNEKTRADVLLAKAATEYSRAALGKLFDMGLVTVGDQAIKRGDKPKAGSVISVELTPIQQEPDVIPLPILYEDDDVLVIDKPAGIISHSRGRYWQEASVASFIRAKTKDLKGERAGIVHRLDRATSGVMIAAKNEKSQQYLQKQFADKKVQKEYIAIVSGEIDPPEAHIFVSLMRNPKKPQLFMPHKDGKYAETTYKVLQTANNLSLVKLLPFTGRTHQLRVHMQYIKHPIIGDVLYGDPDTKEERMYLHAQKLSLSLPNGQNKTFEAPLPEIFNKKIGNE